MSIVVQYSGSGGAVSEDFLGLVNNILRETGERTVANLTSPAEITQLAMDYLNYTVQDIYNRAPWWFAESTVIYSPVADQAQYALPNNYDRMKSDPRHTGGQLRWIDADELDKSLPDQSTSGTPSHYTIWNGYLELSPPPSSDFIDGNVVVGTDALFYVCKKAHTATALDTPITGANYATYWLQDTALTAGSVWTLGKAYVDKRILMRFWRTPVAMLAADDDPDIPEKFIETLKVGARARLKEYLESPDATLDYTLYNQLLTLLIKRKSRGFGPKTVRLYR